MNLSISDIKFSITGIELCTQTFKNTWSCDVFLLDFLVETSF